MKSLIKLEFYKLRKRKSLYICLAIILAQVILSGVLTKLMADMDPLYAQLVEVSGVVFMVEAMYISSFTLVAGIFAVLFVCEDFGQQTIKNIIGKGYSRVSFYMAKALALCAAVSFMFLVTVLFSFGVGTAFFEAGSIYSRFFAIMGAQYLAVMAEMGAAFFIALLIRTIGWSVATYIITPAVGAIVFSLLDLAFDKINLTVSDYWYPNMLSALTYPPISNATLTRVLVTSAVYIAVFLAAGIFLRKRSEI